MFPGPDTRRARNETRGKLGGAEFLGSTICGRTARKRTEHQHSSSWEGEGGGSGQNPTTGVSVFGGHSIDPCHTSSTLGATSLLAAEEREVRSMLIMGNQNLILVFLDVNNPRSRFCKRKHHFDPFLIGCVWGGVGAYSNTSVDKSASATWVLNVSLPSRRAPSNI